MNVDSDVQNESVTLVLALMATMFFGALLNNIVFTSLRDNPGMKASTGNLLLGNLFLCNLIVCTVVLPISAIYVGYSHMKDSPQVGLEFCTLWALTRHATITILPLTLFALSWHVFLAGKKDSLCPLIRSTIFNSHSQIMYR